MQIAMIGVGNMGSAIVTGVTKKTDIAVDVCDCNCEKLDRLTQYPTVTGHTEPGEWLTDAELVVLAVKPQNLEACCEQIRPYLSSSAGILSIAAGVRISSIQKWLGTDQIVRAMPNTPAKVGAGFAGLYASESVSESVRIAAETVLASVGRTAWLESEAMIHLVTAGPGSGPAYVFLFMQELAGALESEGMQPQQARELALATVEGAAALARQSSDSFAQLRENVTSKGGTTARALEALSANGFGVAIAQAVKACRKRSEEMSELFG